MDRLIATNSVDLAHADTPPVSGTPQYATDGNPGLGEPATVWPAYAFNGIQEELMSVILGASITPDRTNNAQLLAAIQAIAKRSTTIALTNANVTLSPSQYACGTILLTGTLSGNVQLIFPAINGLAWNIINNCVNNASFSITAKTASGTGFIVPPGALGAYCDGTSIGAEVTTTPIAYATSSSSSVYTATLAGYNNTLAGKLFLWDPNISCAGGGITLSLNGSGAFAVKTHLGADPAALDLVSGKFYLMWVDNILSTIVVLTVLPSEILAAVSSSIPPAATSAQLQAAAINTAFASPTSLYGALLMSAAWASGNNQTITNGGKLTYALAPTPARAFVLAMAQLTCISAEGGYGVGDVVLLSIGMDLDSTNSHGIGLFMAGGAGGNNVTVVFGANGIVLPHPSGSVGVGFGIDPTKWTGNFLGWN